MSADFMRRIAALEREVVELKRQIAEILAKRGPGRPKLLEKPNEYPRSN